MKKVLYFAALLAIAAGCAKEPVSPEPARTDLVPYSFNAVLTDQLVTEATVSDEGTFAWSEGDEIALYNTGDGQFYTFTSEDGDGLFNGEAPAGATFSVAYYPASIAKTETSVTLPDAYTAADAQSGKIFPMVATPDGTELAFTHLGALLKLSLKDVPVNATEMTVSSDAVLTGDFTLTDADGKKIISAGSGTSRVSIALSVAAKSDLALYVPLPVGQYNYTINVTDGTRSIVEKGTTAAKDIQRASLHKMKAVTISYPTTDYQLIGYFSYQGEDVSWTTSKMIPFEAMDGVWGWLKASSMGMRENHVDFKLYNNSWTGIVSDAARRQVVGTVLPVASNGQGNNITVYGYASALDVYYNPATSELFTLPAGSAFSVPTATMAESDRFALTGARANGDWGNSAFLETVEGQDDWRVVRNIGTNANNRVDFKFWVSGDWDTAFGALLGDWKTSNMLLRTGSSNIVITDGETAATYDIYLNTTCTTVFALPAGSPFAIPSTHDTAEHYTLIGKYSVNGDDFDWGTDHKLSVVEGNVDWLVLNGLQRNSGETIYMAFKLRKDNSWDTPQVGFAESDPWKNLGSFYDATGENPNNCNYYVPANVTEPLSIYVKTDLTKIGIFTQGAEVVFP